MSTQRRRFHDIFLLAAWVYSYRLLLWLFRLLRHAEKDEAKLSSKAA